MRIVLALSGNITHDTPRYLLAGILTYGEMTECLRPGHLPYSFNT